MSKHLCKLKLGIYTRCNLTNKSVTNTLLLVFVYNISSHIFDNY
jgi:hypothetical protein